MCGIAGYIGPDNAFGKISGSLKLLLNRGYDSAGICTVHGTIDSTPVLKVHKKASTFESSAMELLDAFEREHDGNCVGIGHTRWATHGAKTDANAHPHMDSNSMFSVVHNGIIDNYLNIKTDLVSKGFVFSSQTDTEVIPKLLQYNYETESTNPSEGDMAKRFENALVETMSSLSGTWAVLVITTLCPTKIFVCKKGSPVVIGKNRDFVLLSSEQLPLSLYFNDYMTLDDGAIVSIERTMNDIRIESLTECVVDLNKSVIENRLVEQSPAPYKHWMMKEILEQPLSVSRCINFGGRILNDADVKLGGLERKKAELESCKHIVLLGCGTSLNAAQIGAKLLRKLAVFTSVSAVDASEFTEYDIPREKTMFVLFSQSGETKDVHLCLSMLKKIECCTVGIVNVVGSLIARECDCGIYLNAGREVAVASTKSFTSQIVAASLLAVWLAQFYERTMKTRREIVSDLRSLSTHLTCYLENDDNRARIRNVAKLVYPMTKIFVLGKGEFFHVAQESALKLKEVGYMNAEAFPTGSLKHGPFALIDDRTTIILFAFDENVLKVTNTVEEIVSRRGNVILVKDDVCDTHLNPALNLIDHVIEVPRNRQFQSVLAVVPMQLLSYELALLKGTDPDFPRNLAKVVTVE
jgi:glucosamine--fructose-6-phosphate aminotransferase (isomerizing)